MKYLLIAAVALTLGALAGCSGFSYFVANAPAAFGSFHRTRNLAYGREARQRLDVYAPQDTATHPIVVFFHGGSWTTGEKSQYEFMGAALATRGYITVVPNYRLYPEARFPTFVEDSARVVAWVREHAHELRGDADQIVLMGHSAGAHMAAMLALNSDYIERAGVPQHSIVGLVGLSGPYALDPNSDTLRTIFAAPYTAADWRPVNFVTDRAPPALLLHGLADDVVSPTHTEKLRDALLSHNARVETHFYPGRGHADTAASFTLIARFRTTALQDTLAFLGRVTH
ncbi:MAG: alpha/beta hydrolase [Proteobacteria bacterium]|nr:alpha/beta hydrolase [Pseudomonadota bacterium]